mgnify:CR=1 FL=1
MQQRYSKQREEIYSVLVNTKTHPTAEWIYEQVRAIDPSISLGTVYRNLGQLCEQGKAIIVETADKKTHYDGCVSEHGHYVCERCGRVFDLESPCVIPERNEFSTECINSKVKNQVKKPKTAKK